MSAVRNLSTEAVEAASAYGNYETLSVKPLADYVLNVELNRPKKLNTMNKTFWVEYREVFQKIADDPEWRCVIVSGAGKHFSAGLDLEDMVNPVWQDGYKGDDPARKAIITKRAVAKLQDSFTAMENCHKPVIAVTHGATIGGAIDLISAADIRYASKDCVMNIKEVDVGLAADVGTLQRVPKITGNDSMVRELAYSARNFSAEEAEKWGFVGRVFETRDHAMEAALTLAKEIATKGPVGVQTTKQVLNYSRDHSVAEGLDYVCTLNSVMLQTEDIPQSVMAFMQKSKATFSKL
eukprot:Clim_evm24s238 gene=Clim_evmTU24s238